MAPEPPEDAIASFLAITNTTRNKAVGFLKVPFPVHDGQSIYATANVPISPTVPSGKQLRFQ